MVCLSTKDEFQCKSNECIKWSEVCDGISHCSNRADEDCDMCTNDLYICKDLSRINCTLACSTLGYIPCKNYVDKKICSTYSKKSNYLKPITLIKQDLESKLFDDKASSGFFNKYGDDGTNEKTSFLKGIPSNDKFMFSIIGIFVIAFIIISILLFGFIYKRYRQKKTSFMTRIVDNQTNNVNSMNSNEPKINPLNGFNQITKTSSMNSLNNNENLYFMDTNNFILGDDQKNVKLTKSKNKSVKQNKIRASKSYEIQTKPDTSDIRLVDEHQNGSELKNSDYQMYGEPPPSYKQSKFYPKANLSTAEPLLKVCDKNSDEDSQSHIYENIDELNSTSESQQRLTKRESTTAGQKRSKFQALKKSSLNGSTKINKKTNESTDLNNQSDLNDSLEISISPSTLSTSSSAAIIKSNQKIKKHNDVHVI